MVQTLLNLQLEQFFKINLIIFEQWDTKPNLQVLKVNQNGDNYVNSWQKASD